MALCWKVFSAKGITDIRTMNWNISRREVLETEDMASRELDYRTRTGTARVNIKNPFISNIHTIAVITS
jgi:hypothetical protein